MAAEEEREGERESLDVSWSCVRSWILRAFTGLHVNKAVAVSLKRGCCEHYGPLNDGPSVGQRAVHRSLKVQRVLDQRLFDQR